MEMNQTVEKGSTETLSGPPEGQTVPQETLPREAQLLPTEAEYVSTEAHIMPIEAHHAPIEGQLVPTDAHIVHTEEHNVPAKTHHVFQEIKTESLETQNMPPKINSEAPRFKPTNVACVHLEEDTKPKIGDLEIPGSSFTSTIRRQTLINKCSMISMMLDHDNDDSDDDEENNKELDQTALSRLCAVSGEIVLREEARALSELTIRTVLAEERITLQARRMSKKAIQSAYSAAVVTPLRSSKEPNIFRRFLACCFGCCRRRN